MCVKVINEINIGQIFVLLLTVITILIAVIGWFVNRRFNRQNEKLKKQSKYRIEMFSDFLQFTFEYKNKNRDDLIAYLKKLYIKVCILGYKDEIDLYGSVHNKFVPMLNSGTATETEINELEKVIIDVSHIIQNRIRKELKLEEIE